MDCSRGPACERRRARTRRVLRLRWVDLSFNRLTGIKASFTDFKSISVLYLHANKISKFGEIKPLGELAKLRSLTREGDVRKRTKSRRATRADAP